MDIIFQPDFFNTVLIVMAILAVIVFIALQRLEAGYGIAYNSNWGPSVNNRAGWILMEAPVIAATLAIWLTSPRHAAPVPVVMISLLLLHYTQRTFIFPLLIRGKNRMPLAIIAMGAIFNTINAYLITGWIFRISPPGLYPLQWLYDPRFIAGTLIFAGGMYTNIHSDSIIRHLRKPGDTRHYIPRGGMFRYVSSANYLGEFAQWCGFALLTWSWPGAVFALWTFCNLAPRAKKINRRYAAQFGTEFTRLNLRAIIPFLY